MGDEDEIFDLFDSDLRDITSFHHMYLIGKIKFIMTKCTLQLKASGEVSFWIWIMVLLLSNFLMRLTATESMRINCRWWVVKSLAFKDGRRTLFRTLYMYVDLFYL